MQRMTIHHTLQFLEKGSERGQPLLVESRGFSYTLKPKNKSSTIWRCSVRNKKTQCGATIRQENHQFTLGPMAHSHSFLPEGWHRRINTKAGRTTLQFYLLVPLLHQEADHVDLTAKLLSSDKIKKYFKKTSTRIQAQLTDLWSSYNTTDMSDSSFLR